MYSQSKCALLIVCLFIITSCSSRGIPAIQNDVLEKKLSVLMITSPTVTESMKQGIDKILHNWRQSHQIAFEWNRDVASLDDTLLHKIKTTAYDYIIVIGNDLLPSISNKAAESKGPKWTFLQDGSLLNSSAFKMTPDVQMLQIAPEFIDRQKDAWVKQQLAQNASIEWITNSNLQIPAEWAPSEEADHIVYLDHNDQWFQQLAFQSRQHVANWIVLYTAAEPTQIQKVKSLRIPFMDLNSAVSVDLNWDLIFENRLNMMLQNSWKSGISSYVEQELKEIKISSK